MNDIPYDTHEYPPEIQEYLLKLEELPDGFNLLPLHSPRSRLSFLFRGSLMTLPAVSQRDYAHNIFKVFLFNGRITIMPRHGNQHIVTYDAESNST